MNLLIVVAVVLLLCIAGLSLYTRSVTRKITQALPAQGQWLDIDGHRVHYVDRGQGPAVVFVHGLSGQLRNFDFLALDELARDHRLVLIDRPGSGHSLRAPGSDAGIAAQAELVAKVIQRLGLQRPLVVGHSLGGAIALALALNHPQQVRALALIAPLTHHNPRVPEPFRGLAIRSRALRGLLAHTLELPAAIATKERVLAFIFGPEAPVPDFALRGGGLLGLRPQNYLGAAEDLNAIGQDLPSLQRRYGELKLPVAVLYGRGDRVLNYREHGEALAAKVPHARLTLVEGGHMLPVTQPAMTLAWLQPLLATEANAAQTVTATG